MFPRVFNLNSESAVWVAANSLEQAILCYLGHIGYSREEAIAEELIAEPEEVPFEKWKDFTYFKDDGTTHSFENQMWDLLMIEELEVPFILACEDF
ncbi:hypothetical protein SH661x_000397 [Planctomicrobium sp. SH661]|uniref:hypothetical protein n=1 Tax=Planctomicrobium sp. SH661 TaxID=3448124 RepID=UPI003F5C9E5A